MKLADTVNRAATPAIEFRNVSLTFGAVRALKNVSFRLFPGQMILLTGAALSGKSVLLHLAMGLLTADDGEVLIDGQAIRSLSEPQLLELRGSSMGMTFQEDTLFSSLTVAENAAYRLTEHGWSEADTDAAVTEILRFVGLDKDMEKLPEELSIGMRRRLEIARAMIGWSPIMLFDEPTAGLDPITERQVLDLIIRARDIHRISALYVTKELREIPYLATHVAEQDSAGEVEVRKRETPLTERVKVMVLDCGAMAFFGTVAEFASSELPAVTRLTRARADYRATEALTIDPWAEAQRAEKLWLR